MPGPTGNPGSADWEWEGDLVYLIGGRCTECGATTFPVPRTCPSCLSEHVEPLRLSRVGLVYSFSTVHVAPPGFSVPYTVAFVDLPEGVRVFTQLEDAQTLQLGDRLEVTAGTIAHPEDANCVTSYKFRKAPVDA